MTVADRILQFYSTLKSPHGLPSDIIVMNPYKDGKALQLASKFYHKFYDDNNKRHILFGINPGRFGGGVTGVPFTDPIRLQENCAISNEMDKKPELSSRFVYDVIEAYGGPKEFYSKYYISAISPLGFMHNNKNLNYYDIPNWKGLFEIYALERIKEQFELPVYKETAYCIGQGKNLDFLNYLNKKYELFDTIITIPHPRWVMQYRLKRKDEFIQQYIQALSL